MWKQTMKNLLDVPIIIFVFNNVGSISKVDGESMQPTFNPEGKKGSSDFVFLSKWTMKEFNVSRGQVVTLVSPKNPEQKLIKRVIALEGDVVKSTRSEITKVPKGHCWVEGDNLRNSLDSNHFGPVAIGLIESEATYILWPPHRWAAVENQVPRKVNSRLI